MNAGGCARPSTKTSFYQLEKSKVALVAKEWAFKAFITSGYLMSCEQSGHDVVCRVLVG